MASEHLLFLGKEETPVLLLRDLWHPVAKAKKENLKKI